MLDAEDAGMDSEPLFSYYIYPVTQKVDLPRNTIKHIPFITGKEYSAGEKNLMKEGFGLRNLETVIEFNTGDIPLPEGEIAVYMDDGKKLSRFVGEDKIYETPAGGMVEITTGMNFNLQGDRKRITHNRLNRNATEDVIQVKLTNGSDKAEMTVIRERLFGVWTIESATFDGETVEYKELDSRKIEFKVELKAHSTSVLQYKVRYEY